MITTRVTDVGCTLKQTLEISNSSLGFFLEPTAIWYVSCDRLLESISDHIMRCSLGCDDGDHDDVNNALAQLTTGYFFL